ncbi:MAG: flotillin family protein [Bacteroidales bacterium]|nr:flotillin family protein [Bacteroidales bacterium]
MDAIATAIIVILAVVGITISWFVKRYKRCPSDKILVVFGKVGQNQSGDRTAKCIHGGAAFVWPIIQDFAFLDLTPIPINVDLKNALSKQNIRVNVPCRFMVGISTEEGVMTNAAERLLGLNLKTIHDLASDIIIGQLRQVIATMEIEEINSDREKFAVNVSEAVGHELRKIGLKLINVNVTDITDENGYIDALGKEATAKAKNDALRIVAEKEKEGAIGQANARKEQRIQVAAANSEAQIGEADAQMKQRVQVAKANSEAQIGESEAQMKQRVQVAKANSEAVEGENNAKITVANSNADRRKAEAEAEKLAQSAEKINEAETLRASYEAQKNAEMARADKKRATQEADILVPAEVERKRIEIEAEAEAERIRRIAKGNADSIYYEMEAKAKGMMEMLQKQAEGFQQLVKSAGDNPNDAVKLMIADKITEIVKMQTDAVQNIKIDKVTVWDSMSGGKSSTANFLSGMLGSLPPLNDIFKSAGLELPDYLKGKEVKQESNTTETTTETETEEVVEG